ncbi:response regulator transcription factor [Sulfurovum sp.]|uniref:response regulator transcription factor n=1 Tax=Sulfurovum sp. TaxID=1969726 RepID=UPI0025CE99B0|nr:response regulator transcription factor [Sulfurovum sp.]
MKLLLLEDDQILSETLEDFLLRAGYEVDLALSEEEAEELTFARKYDLYLFDINLPTGNGLDFLRALRHAEDETPTIFITALTDMNSMARGFELDAIDYIKKPFEPEELLIRLKAKFKDDLLYYDDIQYDPKNNILRKAGEVVHIGKVPCRVFVTLLKHRGNVVTQEILFECLEHPSGNALRVAINKVKQKLDIEITNIRGEGYMLEAV